MYNKLIEFNEFRRMKEDFQHQKNWENEYRSHTKEMLLNQLLEQQERDYPLMRENTQNNKQLQALVNVIEEKSSTPWLKQVLSSLRENIEEAYRNLSDKIN